MESEGEKKRIWRTWTWCISVLAPSGAGEQRACGWFLCAAYPAGTWGTPVHPVDWGKHRDACGDEWTHSDVSHRQQLMDGWSKWISDWLDARVLWNIFFHSPVTTKVWHRLFEKTIKLLRIHGRVPFVFIPKARQHLVESCSAKPRGTGEVWNHRTQSTHTHARKRTHMHAQTHTHTGTVCELSILFGELLPLVELQEAVGPQAMCVRQTLHDGVEKTLSQTQGTKDRFGTLTQNKITNKRH